jgi:hypothetical protein
MTRTDIIIDQMKKSSRWTRYLLKSFDDNNEFTIPEGLSTNVNWQIGHILLSRHFHSIISIFGKQEELMSAIPFKEYAAHYAMGSNAHENTEARPGIGTLMDNLYQVDKLSAELIAELSDETLDSAPLRDHPVAKTKYAALMWSAEHQMWHNGQLALIKNLI